MLNSLQGPRPLYIGVRLSDKSYSDIRSEYSSEILRKRKEDKEKEGKAKIVAATQVQQVRTCYVCARLYVVLLHHAVALWIDAYAVVAIGFYI